MLTLTSSNFWGGGTLMKCSSTCTSLPSQSPKILPVACCMPTIASSPVSLCLSDNFPPSLFLGFHGSQGPLLLWTVGPLEARCGTVQLRPSNCPSFCHSSSTSYSLVVTY
ncbi:hypothetical protein ACHAXS_000358 [Conticribra weissflogii]